jgi:protein-disulfide isomerase
MEKKLTNSGLLGSGNMFQSLLLLVIVVGAFFMGSLWTKVQILEKGGVVANGGTAPTDQAPAQPQPAAVAPKLDAKDHMRGDKNAKVTLVEYSDLECPFCKTFHNTAVQIVDEYKGKVNWVYRHYPLSFHANAQKEAEASECVAELGGEDAFWKYIDAIYERTTSNGTGFALDKLAPLAAEFGVPQDKFTSCLDSGKYAQKVKDQMAQGSKEGVSGTPGNILLESKSGKTVVIPGAVPFDQIKPSIDDLLK